MTRNGSDPGGEHATELELELETRLETGREGGPEGERDPSSPRDPTALARSIGLRLLTGAPRSRAELAAAMARKEVPDDVATAVLDRFAAVGLVDDAEYAQMLVRSRHADRGLARGALRAELRRKGIDEELAAVALATLEPEQESATARRLASRRLATMSDLPREVSLRRVVAMLARKGYPQGLAFHIVRELLDGEPGASDPYDDDGAAAQPWDD